MRDFDGVTYFKPESGGILMEGFEKVSKPWGMKGIPENFMFKELQEHLSVRVGIGHHPG